jgi:hypothetical protein
MSLATRSGAGLLRARWREWFSADRRGRVAPDGAAEDGVVVIPVSNGAMYSAVCSRTAA